MASDKDELIFLVIIIDINPIWCGKQALKESQITLSKCIGAVMVLGNSHLYMNRCDKLALIANHIQEVDSYILERMADLETSFGSWQPSF